MDRIELIKGLLQKTPEDNFLQHALALEYIRLGNESEARRLFEIILTRDPSYIGSYYQLGRLLEREGERQLAMEWYEKGIAAAREAKDLRTMAELQSAYDDLL